MRALAGLRWMISAAVCLLAGVARADGYKGTGRVTLFPSYRMSLQGPLYDAAAAMGHPRQGGLGGGPGVIGNFAYAATDNIEVAIDPFLATEHLQFRGVPGIRAYYYGVTIGTRILFPIDNTWFPFFGLHTGPMLVYAGGGPEFAYTEIVTQAWGASAGLLWRFSESWGTGLQYQFLHGGSLASPYGTILGRGHWFSLGVTYYFLQEKDVRGIQL